MLNMVVVRNQSFRINITVLVISPVAVRVSCSAPSIHNKYPVPTYTAQPTWFRGNTSLIWPRCEPVVRDPPDFESGATNPPIPSTSECSLLTSCRQCQRDPRLFSSNSHYQSNSHEPHCWRTHRSGCSSRINTDFIKAEVTLVTVLNVECALVVSPYVHFFNYSIFKFEIVILIPATQRLGVVQAQSPPSWSATWALDHGQSPGCNLWRRIDGLQVCMTPGYTFCLTSFSGSAANANYKDKLFYPPWDQYRGRAYCESPSNFYSFRCPTSCHCSSEPQVLEFWNLQLPPTTCCNMKGLRGCAHCSAKQMIASSVAALCSSESIHWRNTDEDLITVLRW